MKSDIRDFLNVVMVLLVLSLVTAMVAKGIKSELNKQECPACHGKGWVEVSGE